MHKFRKALCQVNECKYTKHAHHLAYVAYYLYALFEGESTLHQALVGAVLCFNVLIAIAGGE